MQMLTRAREPERRSKAQRTTQSRENTDTWRAVDRRDYVGLEGAAQRLREGQGAAETRPGALPHRTARHSTCMCRAVA